MSREERFFSVFSEFAHSLAAGNVCFASKSVFSSSHSGHLLWWKNGNFCISLIFEPKKLRLRVQMAESGSTTQINSLCGAQIRESFELSPSVAELAAFKSAPVLVINVRIFWLKNSR